MKERQKGYQIKEQEHFDKLVEERGEIWWGWTTAAGMNRLKRRAHLVAQEIIRFKNPSVLEIGCGTGAFSMYVLKELPLLRLTGNDISPKAIVVATDRCIGYKYAFFEVGDVTSMHYATGTFDMVIGSSILHHLPLKISLQECYRVLKPGGIIWFSEPNMMNPNIAIEKNIHFIGKVLQNTADETAFFRWPLARTLRKVGFQHVTIQPYDFLHPIVPSSLIGMVESVGLLLERIPFLREISGSLMIRASKRSSKNMT